MVRAKPKGPRKATEASLDRAALAYLERFAASAESLRRVLMRKIERSARAHDTDRAEGAAWIEALIERYRRSGLLDDKVYAEAKTASLRRQGRSARAIAQRLAHKGVGREVIEALPHGRRPRRPASARPGDARPCRVFLRHRAESGAGRIARCSRCLDRRDTLSADCRADCRKGRECRSAA
jgi:regulatory protein